MTTATSRSSPGNSPKSPLTPRQKEVVAFIRGFLSERGFAPTQAEIARGLGLRSANAVAQHLRLLKAKGVLSVEPRVARGLRLLGAYALGAEGTALGVLAAESGPYGDRTKSAEPEAAAQLRAENSEKRPQNELESSDWGSSEAFSKAGLPLVGEVAAGDPILAEESIERQVEVPGSLFRPRATYLLRVRGDSMIDAGILSGDLVAVHRGPLPRSGAMAVVRVEGEVTVKYVHQHDNEVELVPANPNYPRKCFDLRRDNIEIEGAVVGVLRLGGES